MRLTLQRQLVGLAAFALVSAMVPARTARAQTDLSASAACNPGICRSQIVAQCGSLTGQALVSCVTNVVAQCVAGQIVCVLPTPTSTTQTTTTTISASSTTTATTSTTMPTTTTASTSTTSTTQ